MKKKNVLLQSDGITCRILYVPIFTLAVILNASSLAADVSSLPEPVEQALTQSGANRSELLLAYELLPAQQHAALNFLIANMPQRDLESLTGKYLADNITAAYKARQDMPWGKDIPEQIFLNYVIPYANLDEHRDQWRDRLFNEGCPLIEDCRTTGQAAVALNTGLFTKTGVVYSKMRPKANQSPLESIEAQKASCTGLSILLVDACRSFAIPARVVGTPLWSDLSGNHTWVEIWDNGWHCLGAAESDELNKTWFSGKAARQNENDPNQKIYAASFQQTELFFPLIWDRSVRYVSAVDVTGRYAQTEEPTLTLSDVRSLVNSAPLAQLMDNPHAAAARIDCSDISSVREILWEKYINEISHNQQRKAQVENQQVSYNGRTMRYVAKKIGQKPSNGWPLYIALHGGGNAPAVVNDSQWDHMQVYYRDSVKAGIYLVPRGVNDDWNLHWVDESFVCYDRIIENLIVFEDVNPNRIYLLGFSAGGDAAYQIPARMPDRWAAAAMSAGHPNGVSVINYAHVPFLIQIGALDAAYDRNKVAAQYGLKLMSLEQEYPGTYRHDCFIHMDKSHHFKDNDPNGTLQTIYADPGKWLENGSQAETRKIDTNSIHWLDKFIRNPLPKKVIWDCSTKVDRSGSKTPAFWSTSQKGKSVYWLSLDRYHGQTPLIAERIVAETNPASNSAKISEIGNHVKILLNEKQFDLSKPVSVTVQGCTLERQPVVRLRTMIRTLLDRGDPNYIFPAALWLTKNPENDWLLEDNED